MEDKKINRLAMTALMTCLVLLGTMVIRIPSPFTQGYVHLGDSMIFLSVLLLGGPYGALASGLGSGLADLLGGYGMYAPWTFLIKGLMGLIMGFFIDRMSKGEKAHRRILGMPVVELVGMVLAGLEMVLGYALVDGVLAGNLLTGFLGAPMNILQFVVGMVLASILAVALSKTPVRRLFYYRLDDVR